MDIGAPRPGMRVRVSFKGHSRVGLIWTLGHDSALPRERIRPVRKILDSEPIVNAVLMRLLYWCSHYYQSPPGEVAFTALPASLKRGRSLPETAPAASPPKIHADRPALSAAQRAAVQTITGGNGFHTYLLEGVTSSGKTEIYLHAIENVLGAGRQALLLLPEIGLTPQTLETLRQRFSCAVAVIHSRRTPTERLCD